MRKLIVRDDHIIGLSNNKYGFFLPLSLPPPLALFLRENIKVFLPLSLPPPLALFLKE
jgi:hypothetical protein